MRSFRFLQPSVRWPASFQLLMDQIDYDFSPEAFYWVEGARFQLRWQGSSDVPPHVIRIISRGTAATASASFGDGAREGGRPLYYEISLPPRRRRQTSGVSSKFQLSGEHSSLMSTLIVFLRRQSRPGASEGLSETASLSASVKSASFPLGRYITCVTTTTSSCYGKGQQA